MYRADGKSARSFYAQKEMEHKKQCHLYQESFRKCGTKGKRQIKGRVDRYEKIVVERIEMFHHY